MLGLGGWEWFRLVTTLSGFGLLGLPTWISLSTKVDVGIVWILALAAVGIALMVLTEKGEANESE